MSLLGRLRIRHGKLGEEKALQSLTRRFPDELPFVMLPQLTRSIERRSLLVAEVDGNVVGFVHWNARRDGWHTLYELVVHEDYQRTGVGRNLLYACPTPVRLRCTVDNDRANRFYENAGMRLAGTESGSKRMLNVWERNILCEHVQGSNKDIPEAARLTGMAYGTRDSEMPYDYPFALDIRWRDYDWEDYMDKVLAWRPVQAMVADYERPEQKEMMLQQVAMLREYSETLRIMVCPKFTGAVRDIPEDCILAISIPSKYAGFISENPSEYRGRKLHLLGGTPVQWLGQNSRKKVHNSTGYILQLQGYGAQVVSVDGNAHQKAARTGSYWADGRWEREYRTGKSFVFNDHFGTMVFSGKQIVKELNRLDEVKQLVLF